MDSKLLAAHQHVESSVLAIPGPFQNKVQKTSPKTCQNDLQKGTSQISGGTILRLQMPLWTPLASEGRFFFILEPF